MLTKIVEKVKFLPAVPRENEKLCDECGGIGWLIHKEKGYISRCLKCYSGIIELCPWCGEPIRGVCSNSYCTSQREAEAEQKRYEKAIKADCSNVPEEYVEMMYSECYSYNEGYFTNFADLIEDCEANEVTVPEYVWSTSKITLSIDAWSVLENACEELHEDATSNLADVDGLQKFLDQWCEEQSGVDSYSVNYKYAITVKR